MKVIRRNYFKYLGLIFTVVITYFITRKFTGKEASLPSSVLKREDAPSNVQTKESKYMYFPDSHSHLVESKIFWDSKVSAQEELARVGFGEQGRPAALESVDEQKKQDLWDMNGFDALLSDNISLDRSLKDIRNKKCKTIKYNSIFPTVSVVIPFFEEHWTTLLRTVVSVINRSPPSLLKEIILVDDGSTVKEFLGAPLDKWLKENQPLGKVVRLPERVGLILARQEGIRVATGEVVIVLDSHCEVMRDWLPPLLEPIVENPRTGVCPLIDVIDSNSFAYYPQDEGGRGAFDWRFYYKRLPLRDTDIKNLPQPFENPVMNGGLFAINRKFFWELGGYDEGLMIWGGEQYDLSFKIWQCGGRLLDAPCSRVGHIFRKGGSKRPVAKNAGDFLNKNYKRVALVWMDEYIEAMYKRNPRLKTIDAGDVSKELEIRNKLQCKSFKWFLENVAPDLVKEYPPVEPPDFANGTISSVAIPDICMDSGSKETGDLILYTCHGQGPQYFSLSYKKNIKVESEQFCWVAPGREGKAPQIEHCFKEPSDSQTWRYDPVTKQLQEKAYKRCLDMDMSTRSVFMKTCDPKSKTQQWIFKNVDPVLIAEKYPRI